MTLEQAFEKIKKEVGTDRKCADYLGITEGYFNGLLRGRRKISEKNKVWIIWKANQLDNREKVSHS